MRIRAPNWFAGFRNMSVQAGPEGIDQMPRLERDTWVRVRRAGRRKVVRIAPQVTLQECCSASREVLSRNDMFGPSPRAA